MLLYQPFLRLVLLVHITPLQIGVPGSIRHHTFDDCRSTCTSVGPTAQNESVIYYEGKFGCSQLRDSMDDPVGDYTLYSNAVASALDIANFGNY